MKVLTLPIAIIGTFVVVSIAAITYFSFFHISEMDARNLGTAISIKLSGENGKMPHCFLSSCEVDGREVTMKFSVEHGYKSSVLTAVARKEWGEWKSVRAEDRTEYSSIPGERNGDTFDMTTNVSWALHN